MYYSTSSLLSCLLCFPSGLVNFTFSSTPLSADVQQPHSSKGQIPFVNDFTVPGTGLFCRTHRPRDPLSLGVRRAVGPQFRPCIVLHQSRSWRNSGRNNG